MKSPEQIGGLPKQPKEELLKDKKNEGVESGRKITTPEEAAEMTRQRRKEFGLGEEKELIPEETEEIEASIQELLKRLDDYNFESFSQKIQEEWYWAELEAEAGKDPELAKAVLEAFLNTLQKEKDKYQ